MCVSTAGRVVEIQEVGGIVTVRVAFERAPEQVCLTYLDEIRLGDFVLVAGGAIVERVTAEEAGERARFAGILLEALAETQSSAGGINQ